MKTRFSAKIIAFAFMASSIFFFSCKKDETPPTPANSQVEILPGNGVFITNEGNFQQGNAKLSYYFYSGTAYEDIFQPVNNRPLGDVCQSMAFIGSYAYVVVNNSGKIEVIRPIDAQSVKTITGLSSPREILAVSSSKAYVTDLFSGSISIINLSNDSISGSISLPGWTEAMKLLNNEVFVCNAGKNNLYVIDPATDQVTDSIAIAPGANSIISDLNGKLWVLCFGDYFTSTPGGLYRIDPSTHLVEQAYPFTTSDYPTRLCANGTGDTLYYINTGVYRMPVASASLPSSAFLTPSGTQSFYGLNVQPQTGEIFVADAQDYSAKGHLLRFTRNGVLLADKMVGVAPAGIYFY